MSTRCGVLIGVAELAFDVRLAISRSGSLQNKPVAGGTPATGSPAQRALKQL